MLWFTKHSPGSADGCFPVPLLSTTFFPSYNHKGVKGRKAGEARRVRARGTLGILETKAWPGVRMMKEK